MGRWEPDARGRLLRAAIELFEEQGYQATTVAQIAARAGLTKTTFFRHFPDKREVLFYGQPLLVQLAAEGIGAAPPDVSPLDAAAAGLAAMAAVHTDEQRDTATRIAAIVEHNEDLVERTAAKRAAVRRAIADALGARGVEEPARGLVADLATSAYYTGFDRWVASDVGSAAESVRAAVEELRIALATVS